MTCECITVDYPSERLLLLVQAAIDKQKEDLAVLKADNDRKDAEKLAWFNSLTRFQKWWKAEDWCINSDGTFNVNWWNQRYDEIYPKNALLELRKVAIACRAADSVRLTGDCLARIDEWAGR